MNSLPFCGDFKKRFDKIKDKVLDDILRTIGTEKIPLASFEDIFESF